MVKKPNSSISIQEEIIQREKRISQERKSLNKPKPENKKQELNSEFAAMTNAFFAANVKCVEVDRIPKTPQHNFTTRQLTGQV